MSLGKLKHGLVLHGGEDGALANVLLPGGQGLVDNGVTGIELLAAKVARDVEELVVLEHLLLEGLGEAEAAEDALVDLTGELVVGSRGRSLGVDLLELLDDLGGGVVGGGAEDALAKELLAVLEDALDELAGVVFGIEQRDGGVLGGGEVQGPAGLLGDGHARQVGHEVTGEEEGGGDTDLADVLFDLGFAVEVVDVGELAVGN